MGAPSHIKGVPQTTAAATTVSGAGTTLSDSTRDSPKADEWNMGYGIVTEVFDGKRVTFIYYGDDGDKVVNYDVPVFSPGMESILTLYGGLQKGLQIRIWFKGESPNPRKSRVYVDVIGGVSDNVRKPTEVPQPREVDVGAFLILSGGMTSGP